MPALVLGGGGGVHPGRRTHRADVPPAARARKVVVGRTRLRLRRHGTDYAKVKFSRRARRQVHRRGKRVRMTVALRVKQGRRTRFVRRTVVLKRYARR